MNGIGTAVGPNLAALTDKSPKALLTAILDPNRAVEAKYISYTVLTDDGLTHSGMIQSETGNTITLFGSDGKSKPILRSHIDEMISTRKSLMPEGLERDVSAAELASVIAFVRGARAESQTLQNSGSNR